jgi:hypothetical protein
MVHDTISARFHSSKDADERCHWYRFASKLRDGTRITVDIHDSDDIHALGRAVSFVEACAGFAYPDDDDAARDWEVRRI